MTDLGEDALVERGDIRYVGEDEGADALEEAPGGGAERIVLDIALVAFAVSSSRVRPWLLPLGGAGHLALTVAAIRAPSVSASSR